MALDLIGLNVDAKTVEPAVVIGLAIAAGWLLWRTLQQRQETADVSAQAAIDPNTGMSIGELQSAILGQELFGGGGGGGAVQVNNEPHPAVPAPGSGALQQAPQGGSWAAFWPTQGQGSGHP